MRWDETSTAENRGLQWPPDTSFRQRGQLSNANPRSRTELSAAGIGRAKLERDYIAVAPGRFVHSSLRFREDQIRHASRQHPLSLGYPVLIEIRTRAHWQRNPTWVASSWSALRLYGMRWFCDHADACFLTRATRRAPGTVLHARRQGWVTPQFPQRRLMLRIQLDPRAPEMRVVPPEFAVAGAMESVTRGSHSWWVPDVPGLDDREVRLIQLSDAVCRLWNMSPPALLQFLSPFLAKKSVMALERRGDAGADSPAETCLRLALDDLAAGMVTQFEVFLDGRLVSVADLAWLGLKVLVYYDGSHHGARDQWEIDNALTRTLLQAGYAVLRYTRAELRNLAWVRSDVEKALRSRRPAAY